MLPGYAPYGYNAAYAAPGYPMVGPVNYDIIGADPAPAPAPSLMDKTKAFLGQETAGIKNGYLLGGAVAVGAIWYAHSRGMFGGRKGRR